jgi:hypothetical protein
MHVLGWLVVVLAAAAILWFVVRAILDWKREPQAAAKSATATVGPLPEVVAAPGERPSDAYLAEARRLAAQGAYREAIAQLLLGAMSDIERRGQIRFRQGLTFRDYLRAVGEQQSRYEALRLMVRTYEPLGFGRRVPEAAHFETSLSGYEAGFRAIA